MPSYTQRVGLSVLALLLLWLGLAVAVRADRAPLLWEYHNLNPRAVGDVNNDGKWDAIGFGDDGAYVVTSTGTAFNASSRWLADFGRSAGGWTDYDTYPRAVADVNSDGKADVVGFGYAGTWVSLSTGSAFGGMTRWTTQYGVTTTSGGWTSYDLYPRAVADVNRDGRADSGGVWRCRRVGLALHRDRFWGDDELAQRPVRGQPFRGRLDEL